MIDPIHPDYTNTPVSPKRPSFGYAPAEPAAAPAVTIVTPFYNTGPIFQETAQSVFQQSLQQWEWLIINDGSTDSEALAILDSYRQRDPRIRVIDHEANKGLSAARNTGFRAARAPYVVQLDSDDLLEPTAVEKWAWFLESYPEFSFVKGYSVGFGAQEYLWEKGFHNGSAFLEANLVNPTSAIRRSVHALVGGYDEADRGGLMDWEFWLRCANQGHWGGTVSEYLDWYRRRPTHSDRWPDFDSGERQRAYGEKLRVKYPQLWREQFPEKPLSPALLHGAVCDKEPWKNLLRKRARRVLLLTPWLNMGGADQFNLEIVEQLTREGWEFTIATTLQSEHSWSPLFARHTPDIFLLQRFLRLADYPRFLRYLIRSRQVDVVLLSHSEFGYHLLPYLRTSCPDVSFVDLCHIEEEYWKEGGYPRLSVEYQAWLDLQIVVSEHLKEWMVSRGANPRRIHRCYINVNAERWRPDTVSRHTIRQELELDEQVPVLLYAGRICFQKQPRVFAETIRQLAQTSRPFVALVAGDGPEMGWLRAFLVREELTCHVRLLGAVANQRMQQLMAAADVFFLPSLWEGIALAIYEAMASGLPIVGADVGGQRELVTPECGVLLARSDEATEAKQYAAALRQLLGDPARRVKMGKAGRKRIESYFRIEQMIEQMLGLFQAALQNRLAVMPALKGEPWQVLLSAVLQEQERYIESVAHENVCLKNEQKTWRQLAEGQEQMIQEQQKWIRELEKGKSWLEEHWTNWKKLAEERERVIQRQGRVIQEWQRNLWGRVSMRLGVLRRPHVIQNELSRETD